MRIGLQVPGISDYFSLSIWRHANERLADSEHQLVLLPADSPNPRNSSVFRMSLYNFIHNGNLDGLILSGSSFLNNLKEDEWQNFLRPFIHDVPTVSIGKTYQGIPMVCTSPEKGIHQAVDHLVKTHGIRDIAFQMGCHGNPEAQERFQSFKVAMEKHGLPLRDEWIFPGEFIERSGFELAEKLLESPEPIPFKAIIVSNDTMAGALMERLVKNHVRVPEDLKIIGFDNIPLSRFYTRPLATIEQSFKEQVDGALDILFSKIQGTQKPKILTLDTSFLPRTSCGCTTESYRALEELFEKEALETPSTAMQAPRDYRILCKILLEKEPSLDNMEVFLCQLEQSIEEKALKDHYFDWSYYVALIFKTCQEQKPLSFQFYEKHGLFQIAQFILGEKHIHAKTQELNHLRATTTEPLQRLTSDLNASLSKDEIFRTLENHLLKLDFKTVQVFLFDDSEDEEMLQTPYGNIPPFSRLYLDFHQGRAQRINQQKNRFDSLSLLPLNASTKFPGNFLVNPLYMQEMHFGFILMGLESGIDSYVYEGIRLGLSSSLQNLTLMEELANANSQLEALLSSLKDSNSKLIIQSCHDSMTSLLNRRGFIQQAQQRMDTCSMQKVPYTVFFADMDGLKKINDSYGHNMGDEAIKDMADILTGVFRREDLIARFGGDEFAILSEGIPSDIIDIIRGRLKEALDVFNRTSGKPFTLNISIGHCGIQHNDLENLENLLQKADMALYEQKKQRKISKK